MAAKRVRKPKAPVRVYLEFRTPRGWHDMKVRAVEYPEHYGVNHGDEGWELPQKQERFFEMLRLLGGKIVNKDDPPTDPDNW